MSEAKKNSPSQISAFILQKMKETAAAYIGAKIGSRQAVLTVPALISRWQPRRPQG